MFRKYASFVRTLALSVAALDETGASRDIGGLVLEDAWLIAQSHGMPLIPNLHKLTVTTWGSTPLKFTIGLLHPKIRVLKLTMNYASRRYFILIFRAISQHCPLLEVLSVGFKSWEVKSTDQIMEICTEVVRLVKSLPHLTSLFLNPQTMLHPLIWEASARHPSLRSLGWTRPYSENETLDIPVGVPPSLDFASNMFEQLSSLSLSIHHDSASRSFSGPFPPRLAVIELELYGKPSPEDVEGVFRLLAKNASSLSDVRVRCIDSQAVLGLGNLLPILGEKLQIFHLQMENALDLWDYDAFGLAASIPNIQSLCLAPDPISTVVEHMPHLTLQALAYFAEYCPLLHTLALYLDAGPILKSHPSNYQHTFRCLKILNLGLSPCPSPSHAAKHLSVLTRDCDPLVFSDFSKIQISMDERTRDARIRLKNKKQWDVTSEIIPGYRELNKMISDLQHRVTMLEGDVHPPRIA